MDWAAGIPGALAGGIVGAGVAILGLWRRAAVVDEQLRELKARIIRLDQDQQRYEHEMESAMREATDKLYAAAAHIQELSNTFALQMTIVNKALDGILNKQDAHDKLLVEHATTLKMWSSQ